MNKNKIDIKMENVAYLIDYFENINSKLRIKDLDLNLIMDSGSTLKIQNIDFSNYGLIKIS